MFDFELHFLQLLEDSLENRLDKMGGLLSDSEKAEGENKEGDGDENKVHIFLNSCNLLSSMSFPFLCNNCRDNTSFMFYV